MNLRHVEIFHAVYVNGSVSAAARALNVSQPSVTKTLRYAEQQLGYPLFQRHKNRLIPTEDAHALFSEVSEIHARMASLRQTSRNLRRGAGHVLRVSTLPSLALDLLPQACARFLADHPDTYFDLQILHHDELARRLYERETDVVIAVDVPRNLPLAHHWLGEAELGILYREEDMPVAPARIELRDVTDRRFVSLEQSGPIGDLFVAEAQRLNVHLNDIASARTFYVAAGLVRAGVGMAVVDSFTAASVRDQGLSFRPLRPSLAFDILAITLEARPPSTAMSDFLSLVSALIEAP